MIILRLNRKEFEYDIQALVKSFYPEHDMKTVISEADDAESGDIIVNVTYMDTQIHLSLCRNGRQTMIDQVEVDFADHAEAKNRLKRTLYRMLCEWEGKSLPWGSLTGIRPTKLVVSMLENGASDGEVHTHMRETYGTSDDKIRLALEIAKREMEVLSDLDYENGYSLYIGIPFCPTTCAYCSFTSYPLAKYGKLADAYVDALLMEMDYVARVYRGRPCNSIYIGGGTPTALTVAQLERVLKAVRCRFDFSNVLEFTVEAGRPDTITLEKLEILKKYGVTRICINPQTMNQKTLDLIGRRHTVEQTKTAFFMARMMGFDNINMDMIVGLPGETADDVRHTLEELCALKPDGLTVHSLAIKRAARLNTMREVYAEYSRENDAAIMHMTEEYAKSIGLAPYYLYRQKNMTGNMENVGYAAPGKAGRYNILIMEEKQTILALGAGAISKFVGRDAWHGPEKKQETRQAVGGAGGKTEVLHDMGGAEGSTDILHGMDAAEENTNVLHGMDGPEGNRAALQVTGEAEKNRTIERVANVKNLEIYINNISEMIDRKRRYLKSVSPLDEKGNSRFTELDAAPELERFGTELEKIYEKEFPEALDHGVRVSNLAFALAKHLGYDEEFCRKAALAGMLHDVGKMRMVPFLYSKEQEDAMNVKKIRYIRSHARIGYDILKEHNFDDEIAEAVLYHHENYDGSGFPRKLKGEQIPELARILRICDVYTALTTDRSYRESCSGETAMRLLIDEAKNFDLKMILAFQQMMHEEKEQP
ncbi:MAG: coproporphyrinogen dehydrogenase HemZ [Lachnospiraceae bacterium]|nr:coproporphyrinogen dehydrogenase HemZ [Lachnospiraceae bacterium]